MGAERTFRSTTHARIANLRGARAVQNFLRRYHKQYEGSRRWINPALPTHGPGRIRTRFGEMIARGWDKIEVRTDGATVSHSFPAAKNPLNLKIFGGVVTAKRARALTIPVDPRAHGRSTRQFTAATGLRLFRPKGKDYLATVEGGRLKVIYLLRSSVTFKPWPHALPSNEAIGIVFADELEKELARNAGI